MYSSEALVSMADGSFKNINNIKVGDAIYNKFMKPVSVSRVHSSANAPVVEVQFNNGTGIFYAIPASQVFVHHAQTDKSHNLQYDTISNARTEGARLKSTMKFLSPQSDVSFTTYNDSDTTLTKTVYCLHTLDGSKTYFVNKTIVCCCSEN